MKETKNFDEIFKILKKELKNYRAPVLSRQKWEKININITTPQTKERQTMNLTLEITSKSTSETEIDETYLQGQTLELSGLKLIKEETTEKIDFTIITLGLIVILVSLIIILFFF